MDNLLAGQVITEEESDAFYCMKAFAILSVVAAHTSTVMNGELFSEIVTKFWSVYARVGVPCFLILSGFFFQFTLESKREFWRKKATRVMKPWILCGMATYLLGCIRGRSFSFLGLLQWVAGYGSWYYYMTVLMMLYLFFGYFSSDICCCGALLANVLSLAYHDYFGENSFQYLNILNWAGFFAAGILMRRKRWDRKIRKCRWIVVVSALLCACGVTISVCTGRFGYFHLASFLYELSFFPVLLKLCLQIRIEALKKHMIFIGQQTFFIFLTHMQIVQAIGTRIPNNMLKNIFYPVLALEIMTLAAWLVVSLGKKSSFVKYIARNIGIRI